MENITEGAELVSGDEQTATASITNLSTSDKSNCFLEFVFNSDVYELTPGTDWEIVSDQAGDIICSYSTGGTMTPVGVSNSAEFSVVLRVISTPEIFQSLTDDDMVVEVYGHGISTKESRTGNLDAWSDFENLKSGS